MNDDQALISAVLGNQPGAFARLVQRHQRLVWHLIVRMVKNPADADELAQETFLMVHRKLAQFRAESSLSTWIGQIAFSLATRFLQRKKIPLLEPTDADDDVMERVSDDTDLAGSIADAELFGHVAAAMEKLPAIQRTLLTLFHLEEQTVEDAALITGLPIGTVKSYLFRARARLRAALEDHVGVAA
ncbi:MAG: RNA polymerase sigma factor [Pseudomarimonas sp.]